MERSIGPSSFSAVRNLRRGRGVRRPGREHRPAERSEGVGRATQSYCAFAIGERAKVIVISFCGPAPLVLKFWLLVAPLPPIRLAVAV